MERNTYLARIGYTGSTAATAATLRALHLAHLRSVPFENLDIHLGRPITLDHAALYDKIVRRRRGGFCYEQNGLFAWLLETLGFEVRLLSAQVAGADGRLGADFDHLALHVRCPDGAAATEAAWLVDVGFGDSFNSPLRLDRPGEAQPDGLRAYRIEQENAFHTLWQRSYDGRWVRQYRFALQARQLADFAPMCAYHQTSPDSHFTQRRVCTMATEDGRVTLAEQTLISTRNGERLERPVDPDAYRRLLAEQFGVEIGQPGAEH